MEGDVTVAVSHSTVNYKDGLALTGRAPVARKFPMIPGIDLAGTVEESSNPNFKPGDKVLLNGYGLSETHFGGYSELARVKGDWLVPLPKEFSAAEAMAIGTAGYTAMLAGLALEDAHVTPAKGSIVVTGAAGGVGSVAVALLAKLGYRVIASTGRPEEEAYLKSLGAADIIPRAELAADVRPLAKSAGRAAWTASARRRSPISSRRHPMVARSRLAVLPVAWICPPAWHHSFCAAFRFWGSIRFRCQCRAAGKPGSVSRATST